MDETMKLMLVEDDETLAEEICVFLRRWGYDTVRVRRFDAILEEFTRAQPGLVLMDVNLPFYDGFYWCSQIRRVSEVPVLYISSRGEDADQIMAIAQGGDDYVEKPFRLELLRAKIEALLRRTYRYKVRQRSVPGQGLFCDELTHTVFFDGKEIPLTRSERRILCCLMERRPDVVSREELMMELWDTDEYVSDGTLTTLVCRLRGKLAAACGKELIGTKKGQGYFVE